MSKIGVDQYPSAFPLFFAILALHLLGESRLTEKMLGTRMNQGRN